MAYWTARRDIPYCSWSVSEPSLDALHRWEELHCASFRHMWVSPSYVPQRLTLKLLTKCKFWVSSHSQHGKLCAELWGETSIAYLWIISKPALDIEGRWEKLLTVSVSHLWVSPCDFSPRLTHKVHTKYLIFNTLSVSIENGILFTKRDISIHCSWSVPKPSLGVLSWWYELLYASFCHSWISPDSQNAHEMPNFKYPLSTENWMIFYNERQPLLM